MLDDTHHNAIKVAGLDEPYERRVSSLISTSNSRPLNMQHGTVQPVLLLPAFLTIELTRAALWVTRTAYDPDHDGGLLRVFVALLVGLLRLVPSPVWTVVTYAACVAWVPIRGVLWVWGIGRGGLKKRSPRAVTRWYAHTRKRRAETLQRQQRCDNSFE